MTTLIPAKSHSLQRSTKQIVNKHIEFYSSFSISIPKRCFVHDLLLYNPSHAHVYSSSNALSTTLTFNTLLGHTLYITLSLSHTHTHTHTHTPSINILLKRDIILLLSFYIIESPSAPFNIPIHNQVIFTTHKQLQRRRQYGFRTRL